MMGPTHRVTGALAGASLASASAQPWHMIAMTALVATATSHGWSSPDMDLTRPWRATIARTGAGEHRYGLSHWWGLPVAAAAAAHTYLPPGGRWVAYALIAGWASHLIGDLVFGHLALYPWGGPRVGLGIDTGGFIETGRVKGRWPVTRWARGRRLLPFSPARTLIGAALAAVLLFTPTVDDLWRWWP